MVHSIGDDECCNVSHPYVEWVIDSTTSYHVTPRKELFNTGYTLVLKDVRHVPDMRLNLISTHILDKEGYGNYFEDCRWRLSR